jgi:hypothetical protein
MGSSLMVESAISKEKNTTNPFVLNCRKLNLFISDKAPNMTPVPDSNGHIILNYPVLIVNNQKYLSYGDFIHLSGLPKTSLFKLLSAMGEDVISEVKIMQKNRAYYRLDFCLRFHHWKPAKN